MNCTDKAALIPEGREECYRQVARAEKELRAFLAAVQELYGDAAAAKAAEEWIALAGSLEAPLVKGVSIWRSVTILASSRLAMNHCGSKTQASPQTEEMDAQ
jgi:hypothetical protein